MLMRFYQVFSYNFLYNYLHFKNDKPEEIINF